MCERSAKFVSTRVRFEFSYPTRKYVTQIFVITSSCSATFRRVDREPGISGDKIVVQQYRPRLRVRRGEEEIKLLTWSACEYLRARILEQWIRSRARFSNASRGGWRNFVPKAGEATGERERKRDGETERAKSYRSIFVAWKRDEIWCSANRSERRAGIFLFSFSFSEGGRKRKK